MNHIAKRRSARKQGGWTSIEIMVGIAVVASFFIMAATVINLFNAFQQNKGVAHDAQIVADAANNWLNANASSVVASANPTATIPLSTFASYLPSTFNQTTNAFQQGYSLRVFQSRPNQLDAAIVTTGGTSISDGDSRAITNLIGGAGGYVSSADTTTAQGTFGAWQLNWSNFGGSPGAGHIAIALFVQNAGITNGYLYRNVVAGHPELNQMNTAIDMNNNNLNNASEVHATQVITPAGNGVQIGTSSIYGDNSGTSAIRQDGTLYVTNAAGTTTGPAIMSYVQLTSVGTPGQPCTPDSAVERSSTYSGLVLCSFGRWQPIGTANNGAGSGVSCSTPGMSITDVNNVGYICNNNYVMVRLNQTLSNFNTVYKAAVYDTYPAVYKPSCPNGGTPVADIIPQSTGVNVTVGPPYETVVYRMNDNGAYWIPQITLIQASTGAGESGNDLGLSATAVVQCQAANGPAPGY